MIWDLNLGPAGALSQIISIPEESGGYFFRSFDDGTPAISATITLLGTISAPHIDQAGSGTLFIQLLERKVFVVWPPTEKILKWFS